MVSHQLPAAVIFDMDGVLVDSEPVHAACYVRAFAENGCSVSVEQYRQAVSLGHATVKKFFYLSGGNIDRWNDVFRRKAVLYKQMLHERGRLMPGIKELLQALAEADIPVALATSAAKVSLDAVMSRFDLTPYFQYIVTQEDVTAIKPDPAGYICAAEKLGVECAECVAVEDSPRGVLAAHRAGMKCIAVPTSATRDGDFSPATLKVRSLKEVNVEVVCGLFIRRAANAEL